MKPAIFEMSSDARLLRQHLANSKIGEFISYLDLSNAISKPTTGASSALQSAINSLLRHEQMVFAVIRGEGLKRLNDSEIISSSNSAIDGLRRKARKAAIKISAVQDFASLSPKEQLTHTTRLSIFTAITAIASDKGQKAIANIATGRAGELPIHETLKAFTEFSKT